MKRSLNPKRFFTLQEEEKIIQAIQEAELKTSGEIRVHIAKPSKRSAYEEGVKTFEKLGMTVTKQRNAVLIYIVPKNHEFAILGDQGIHEKVSSDFWDKVREVMEDDFRHGDFVKGVIDGVLMCGEQLGRFFPRKPEDTNELTDQLST